MEQLTKNQAVATSQEAVQNQNEPQLRDENAHNDKSVHGVLNPTYQAGLRREDRKSGSAGMPRPTSYAVFCLKKKTTIDETVVDVEEVENLPAGVDGTTDQWVDLDSEGLSGVLVARGGT